MVEPDLGAVPVAMRIHRTITDASGRHRVVIRQQAEGFTVEEWEQVNKRWSRTQSQLDGRSFPSYAAAVVAIGRHCAWLVEALSAELSDAISLPYHLELLRGMTYRFQAYPCGDFGDHHHCENCWAKFMFRDEPDILQEGYAGRYFIPGGNGEWQWSWICRDCFERFRERLQWEVNPESAG